MANRNSGLVRQQNGFTRFDPWNEITAMRRSMDELMNRVIGFPVSGGAGIPRFEWEPNVEMYETDEEVVVSVDLPGFDQKEINLELTSDTFRLTAERSEGTESPEEVESTPSDELAQSEAGSEGSPEKKAKATSDGNGRKNNTSSAIESARPHHPRTYHVRSQSRRSVSVSYSLPSEIDPDRATATYRNGVLEVHLPRPERIRPRQVRVEVRN